jgi:hypothetical protein
MTLASRLLQFLGIVVVGIGLFYGVANNDMTNELLFAAIGFVLFVVGRAVRR